MSAKEMHIHLDHDNNLLIPKRKCNFKQFLFFITPKCLISKKYESTLKTQQELCHFYFKNGDYRILVRSYEQFISQIIQNPLKIAKTKNTLDLQNEIFDMYLKASWKLQNHEQIESLENVFRLLQQSSYNETGKMLNILKAILKIYQFIYEETRAKQSYTNIFNTYCRIYHQTPQSKKISAWNEYVTYEYAKGHPNISALIKFYKKNIKIVRIQPVIFEIYQKNLDNVKTYWNFLRNNFAQYYNKYYKFLLIIDLKQIEEMRKCVASEQTQIFVRLIFKEQLKKIDLSQNFGALDHTLEMVNYHKQKIELYKQNQWNQCIEYAYISLLNIYTNSFSVQRLQINESKSDEIFQMYDYILQFRSLKGIKEDSISQIWNEFFRSQIVKPNPNYDRILSLRKKYFQPSLGDGFIYFFLRDDERVKGLIVSLRIKGKFTEACQLEYLFKISKQKSLKRLQYYINNNKNGTADWQQVMRRKIILRLKQEFKLIKREKKQKEQNQEHLARIQ